MDDNKDMKILGFIPARGGSRRIPDKNIKYLSGKPLISYTIEATKKSNYINRIVVSTDSKPIADVAKKHDVEVPFMRPKEISGSKSTEMEFFNHLLDWFEDNENYIPDLIVLLYPTSPFRTSVSIDKAIDLINKHPDADSLRSVTLCSEHPYKMWQINESGLLKPFVEAKYKNMHTLSYSLLPTVYIQNASIYITKPNTIRNKKSPTGDVIIPFVMDKVESIDINEPVDFLFAQQIMDNS